MTYFFQLNYPETSEYYDWKKTPDLSIDSMFDWAHDNLSDLWGFDFATSRFWFTRESDYILFVLRWME